jgi:hypothetical protein
MNEMNKLKNATAPTISKDLAKVLQAPLERCGAVVMLFAV